ncbi:heme exporter protein B [Spirosomataceae bacterium TFI 002]|nr:heme exporter protein B [Spirosomataceae bacterium TFI 002]
MKEIAALIGKDLLLELRNRYALSGIILYVISTVFICYLSFKLKVDQLNPITWNALFWIIILFTAINAIAKSFQQESKQRQIYFYTIANASSIIVAKLIYNFLLMSVLLLLGIGVYALFLGNPVQDFFQYLAASMLGAFCFASTLTLVAGIAAKADNTASLMALLSFPIILPSFMILMRITKNAMDGLEWNSSSSDFVILAGINIIVIALSYILFPYLWRT